MYIATIPNRGSPPAILLRQGYREGGKVKTRTVANLSKLPPEALDAVRRVLKGETLVNASDAFEAIASLQHGHVQAVLDTMGRIRSPPRRRSTGSTWCAPASPKSG